jgi:hypothetical protein
MSTEKITNRLKIISDISDEIKKVRALYVEDLEQDQSYVELQEEKKKVREQSRTHRLRALNNPTFNEYELHIKELREDMKENKEILAQEIVDYYKESGKMEIMDEEGHTRRVVFSVKLVKN